MLYPYAEFPDETNVTHSEIIKDDKIPGGQKVLVNCEQPVDAVRGFNEARAVLPTYEWLNNDGFSQEQIKFFEKFMHSNAHLIFKYAAEGGMHLAKPFSV